MSPAEFACPRCKTAFVVEPGTVDAAVTCPSCASELEGHFFPAFFLPAETGMPAAALIDQTEASCFYHPQKQAVRVCDGCGRLICALCSIELGNDHLCPHCVSSGKKKGKITTLENSRTRYDNIAMSLAIFGLLTSFLSFIMAPAAIYIAVRHWKSPVSLLSKGRARMVIALVVAVISLVIWGGAVAAALLGPYSNHHHHS